MLRVALEVEHSLEEVVDCYSCCSPRFLRPSEKEDVAQTGQESELVIEKVTVVLELVKVTVSGPEKKLGSAGLASSKRFSFCWMLRSQDQ